METSRWVIRDSTVGPVSSVAIGARSVSATVPAARAAAGTRSRMVVVVVTGSRPGPVEVIVRNRAAGSFSKRMGVAEGTTLACPILEYSYKNDELGDPFINSYYIRALNIATDDEMEQVKTYSFRINEILKAYLDELGIELIDFKLEFGRFDGTVILADEISPDTCRFWDKSTGKKLDKDRFRRDLGDVEEAYHEIIRRLMGE